MLLAILLAALDLRRGPTRPPVRYLCLHYLSRLVPSTLEPPATTKPSGGNGTGKGEQNQKPAGKGKKRNAPAAAGDKASPVKTGKGAKSSKQSAKSDKAQCALQLSEKGFTLDQITAMLRN